MVIKKLTLLKCYDNYLSDIKSIVPTTDLSLKPSCSSCTSW